MCPHLRLLAFLWRWRSTGSGRIFFSKSFSGRAINFFSLVFIRDVAIFPFVSFLLRLQLFTLYNTRQQRAGTCMWFPIGCGGTCNFVAILVFNSNRIFVPRLLPYCYGTDFNRGTRLLTSGASASGEAGSVPAADSGKRACAPSRNHGWAHEVRQSTIEIPAIAEHIFERSQRSYGNQA